MDSKKGFLVVGVREATFIGASDDIIEAFDIIQDANSIEPVIVYAEFKEDADVLAEAFHRLFSDNHIHGNWFSVDSEVVSLFL